MTDIRIDPKVLQSLRLIMEGDFNALIEAYIRDAEEKLRGLRQSLQDNDLTSLGRAAHSLKGSSSNLGVVTLVELCGYLEASACEQPLQDGNRLIAELEEVWQQVRAALLQEIDSAAAS